jgi:anti-anti-sigma regulatory factor
MNSQMLEAPVNVYDPCLYSVVSAESYLNKQNGERIERECRDRLEAGCQNLVINFSNTSQVNSIGISILLGVIGAAQDADARLIFAGVNDHTVQLFELLGLTRHVALARDEHEALDTLLGFDLTVGRS